MSHIYACPHWLLSNWSANRASALKGCTNKKARASKARHVILPSSRTCHPAGHQLVWASVCVCVCIDTHERAHASETFWDAQTSVSWRWWLMALRFTHVCIYVKRVMYVIGTRISHISPMNTQFKTADVIDIHTKQDSSDCIPHCQKRSVP
jgi:hypothetical protein